MARGKNALLGYGRMGHVLAWFDMNEIAEHIDFQFLVYVLNFYGFLMLFYLRADEEPVDPKKYLEERCKPQCVKPLYEYEKCVKRVEKDDTGHKHCTGQYFDYWSCIDKCVAPKLLEKLK
uniref:Complex III subunit VI n=1 Tax=Oryza rufipogon TaxID=4529 RepID=A0A0E0R4L3_ORYRU